MSELLVRVVPGAEAGDELIDLGGGGFVERFQDRATELGNAIREISHTLASQFPDPAATLDASWQVDQIELSVSLDLEAEAGVILAKTKTTAGFDLTFTWSRSPSK